MRVFPACRLTFAAFAALMATSACSSDCPNCPGAVTLVKVSPGTASVLPGRPVLLVAEVLDAKGHFLSGQKVVWSTQDASVATVDSTGVVTGVNAGSTMITAKAAGLSGTGTINVVTSSTFSGQVAPIIAATCGVAFCHVSPGPSPNMTNAATAYTSLTTGGFLTPGDTTTGILLDRLRSTTSPMPPGGALAVTQPGNYDLIALWIQEGAPNN
ncbi:MAG TPA: Ig-like domain-containing protein [Gemmatimonadales bacterium]|nr:Ig-like domain-containing protein [Gemmatimonadales bacterium]